MATETTVTAPAREYKTPDIMTARGGVFWGSVLMLIGTIWFLNVVEVIDLGTKFADSLVPVFLMISGLYLLAMKVGK